MSEQSAIAFAERLKGDEAFRNRFAAGADVDARLAVAREAGYDLTPEDSPALASALGIGEPSDEDLDQIGGAFDTIIAGTGTLAHGLQFSPAPDCIAS